MAVLIISSRDKTEHREEGVNKSKILMLIGDKKTGSKREYSI
jgi:hypothetical protein